MTNFNAAPAGLCRRVVVLQHRVFCTVSLALVASAFLFLAFAANTASAAERTGIVRKEFIFENASFLSCHASTIAESRQGLVAAWFGGTGEGKSDVGIWSARQEHGKWTKPVEVAQGLVPGERRYPCWNPVLFQPVRVKNDGGANPPLWLFYKVGPSPRAWWGMLITSEDSGKTWSHPQRLPPGILGPIKNKPTQLASGEILCPTSVETSETPSRWRVYFERTADLGATWAKTGYLNDGTTLRAIQPSILRLDGQRLLALGRTAQGRIFRVASNDGGRTWGTMELTSLPNPNSGIDAVTLKDQRHLLVYNPSTWDRTPLSVAISRDGIDWKLVAVLENDPGEFSYPAVIQTHDGSVHITYTWQRRRIRHCVLDPAQIGR
jgi:predicted neuraminidase